MRLVGDVLPIQDHAEPQVVPLRDDQLRLVPGDAWRDGHPPAARRRDRLERQPTPVPDLDRIATVPGGEQRENPALAEGGVHAKLQRHASAELATEVVDDLPQERDRLLGVVDIARAVLQPEDVAGLRDVGQERVVAQGSFR